MKKNEKTVALNDQDNLIMVLKKLNTLVKFTSEATYSPSMLESEDLRMILLMCEEHTEAALSIARNLA